MSVIDYLIDKMNLNQKTVDEHIAEYEFREDAKKRIRRQKFDDARDYEPTEEEIEERRGNENGNGNGNGNGQP